MRINFLRLMLVALVASVMASGIQHGVGPAVAAIWNWSVTASDNGSADPTVNWAAGMSPSSVSGSGRAMMAAVASWRNDLGAITATTGTSTAYVLASNQGGFVANAAHDGFLIGFIPNVTNAVGPVTINVDGAGAKPLRTETATAISRGALALGSKYLAAYKFSTDEWLLINTPPQQHHPSAAKFWIYCTASGTSMTRRAAYNSTSSVGPATDACGRTGVGIGTLTFTTNFSGNFYSCVGTTFNSGGTTMSFNTMLAAQVSYDLRDSASSNVDIGFSVVCYGDQ